MQRAHHFLSLETQELGPRAGQGLESRLCQPVPAALQAPCQALPSWVSAKS